MAVTYVSGDRKQVTIQVGSAQTIAKGELLAYASSAVKNFAQLADSGTKAQNQAAARDVFAGVAMRASTAAVPTTIPVATAGVFNFPCTSATYEVGDLVGPIGTGSASAVGVSSTTLEAVASGSLAIGKVAKRGTTVTTIDVEIFPTVTARPVDDTVAFDTISEVTAGAGVTLDPSSGTILAKDGSVTASVSVITSLLTEYTATAGVVADGVRLKDGLPWTAQAAPGTLNATGTLTAALLLGGIVTTTSGSAVTATLDTGAAMDTAITSIVGTDTGFFWSVINTGSNTLTVTASSNHTVVGLMTVAAGAQRRFFTRRTATNTWITYSVS